MKLKKNKRNEAVNETQTLDNSSVYSQINTDLSDNSNDDWATLEENEETPSNNPLDDNQITNDEVKPTSTPLSSTSDLSDDTESFDPIYEMNFDEALASDLKIYTGIHTSGHQVLKIPLPYSAKAQNAQKQYDEYTLRTPSESNLFIADLYKSTFSIWKMAFDKNLPDEIRNDIEDLYKVLIYSDSDMSDSTANTHTTFLDTRLRDDARVFNGFKIETTNNQKQAIRMNVPYGDDLDSEISAYKASFTGPSANARLKLLQETLTERENLCKDLADYPCFNNFYLLFNNRDDCKAKMLQLFKVINYLFYRQLRTKEIIGDLRRKENGEATLQTSADALSHLRELRNKILIGDKTTKAIGSGLDNLNVSITYSTDIIDFYGWKTKLLDWFVKVCFGNNIDLYYTIYSKNNKTNMTTLQNLINEPNNLRKNILKQLEENSHLIKHPMFLNFGKEKYVDILLTMLAEYNYSDNIYWHYYFYYLNNYKNSTLHINNKPVQFSTFQYLVWMICVTLRAVLHQYWNTLLVLKYCNTNTLASINKLLTKFNSIKRLGDYLNGYDDVKDHPDWFKTKYLPFIDMVYAQNSLIFPKRFKKSINEFIIHYMNSDDEI